MSLLLSNQVAVQEVRRLMQFGVTTGEMERYKAALLRDSEQMASQGDSIASLDNLNLVMEYLALGHTYMNPPTVGILLPHNDLPTFGCISKQEHRSKQPSCHRTFSKSKLISEKSR